MRSLLNPYLSFSDTARPAMEFYRSVFGGDLQMTSFGQAGMSDKPEDADKVMHSQLQTGSGFTLMASDTPPGMSTRANGTISLSGDGEAELRGYWDKLSPGASVMLPLVPAPWGDTFGMLTDRFGVGWMVNIAGKRG